MKTIILTLEAKVPDSLARYIRRKGLQITDRVNELLFHKWKNKEYFYVLVKSQMKER